MPISMMSRARFSLVARCRDAFMARAILFLRVLFHALPEGEGVGATSK